MLTLRIWKNDTIWSLQRRLNREFRTGLKERFTVKPGPRGAWTGDQYDFRIWVININGWHSDMVYLAGDDVTFDAENCLLT